MFSLIYAEACACVILRARQLARSLRLPFIRSVCDITKEGKSERRTATATQCLSHTRARAHARKLAALGRCQIGTSAARPALVRPHPSKAAERLRRSRVA